MLKNGMHTDKTSLGAPTPPLETLPACVPARLIDEGLLQYEASIAGFAERYRRGETPHTVHVWWARRPHTAMRALVFACLCEESSAGAFDVMRALSSSPLPPPLVLESAREALKCRRPESPTVLDMFGGGGTIPFESALLGAETYSIDCNELAVFIQRSLLNHAGEAARKDMTRLLDLVGRRVLNELASLTRPLFPQREHYSTYIWSYTLQCSSCEYRFLLSKRPWLSRKNGRHLALRITDGGDRQQAAITEVSVEFDQRTPWLGRNGTVACPKCGFQQKPMLPDCQDELLAVVACHDGKSFSQPVPECLPTDALLTKTESSLLSELGWSLPSSELPVWSGIVNPAVYGMRTHAELFNKRQRVVVLSLLHLLADEYNRLREEESPEIARAVIGWLSGLVDQLVDWNCRLSMWIPQNQQVGRAFCGPGVAMLWDYAETDPVSKGPSNLWAKLDRILAGVGSLNLVATKCSIICARAQAIPYADESFDAIITDPPYYDNVFYSILADFFYAWKRPLIRLIEPSLAVENHTSSRAELVASSFRSGDSRRAHEDYCAEMAQAIREAARVLKPNGVFALLYSHACLRGWEALVRAYRPTALRVTSVQPLNIERKQRPRAMTSDAVNTCVVFVARRSGERKPTVRLASVVERLDEIVKQMHDVLRGSGWCDGDIGVALFAQGVGMLMNYESLSDCDDDLFVLKTFEDVVRKYIPDFHVSARTPL